MHRFKELKVWQKSVDLSVEIHNLIKIFPSDEKFGIISQMRRRSVFISSDIAEGAGRNTKREFIQFLGITEGSANESETQLIITSRLNFLSTNELNKVVESIVEIKNMLFSFKRSL